MTVKQEEKKAEKPKKAPKRPTVYKAGKWNPDTELVMDEVEKCGASPDPDFNCCQSCNMKNLHRAINNNDAKLLHKLVMDTKNIANLLRSWSVDSRMKVHELICEKQSLELLEAIYPNHDELVKLKKQQPGAVGSLIRHDMVSLRNEFYYLDRNQPSEYLLHQINTGNVSSKAYGVKIRAVNMTRGNRQGNNAFVERHPNVAGFSVPVLNVTSNFDTDFCRIFGKMQPDFLKKFNLAIDHAAHNTDRYTPSVIAMTGNRKLVASLVEPKVKHENYGYNKLHLDVLKLDKLVEKYPTVSITKKGT